MIWDDKELATVGELFHAVCSVQTSEQAAEFMRAYRAENAAADENVGYVIGYGDEDTRARLYGLFDLVHPIFRRAV